MRTIAPMLLGALLVLFGCKPADKKSEAEDSEAGNKKKPTTNTGIIDGNGAEIGEREPFTLPVRAELDVALARLEPYEGVWVGLMRVALDGHAGSFEPVSATLLLKTDKSCFLAEKPETEVRAYYTALTGSIIFCKPFHDADAATKVAIVLHELTHVVLHRLKASLPGAEEEASALAFEAQYKALIAAADAAAARAPALELSKLVLQRVPAIDAHLVEVDLARYVGAVRDVQILKAGGVTFPVPEQIAAAGYQAPRLLEYALGALWLKEERFKAETLDTLPAAAVLADLGADGLRTFKYPNSESVAEVPLEALPEGCADTACQKQLMAVPLDRAELTPEFLAFIDGAGYGANWIRTVGRYGDGDLLRDRVYLIQKD